MVAVTEGRGLSTMKEAGDLHAVHTTILQKEKNNVYQLNSNNTHQLYNTLGRTDCASIPEKVQRNAQNVNFAP
jgi:hypothetical protein